MRRLAAFLALGALGALGGSPGLAQQKPAAPPAVNPRLPKDAQAAQLMLQGEDLQAAGKYAEAAKVFQEAAELTPEDWLLWDKAGWAHLDVGDAAAALKAFQEGRKVAPPGTPPSGGLVIANFGLGQQKEMLEVARQLVPAEVADQAAAVVAKGLAAKPRTEEWYYALGFLHARVLGNSPRGLEPLEAVVKANPKRAEAWLLLAELNQALNRGPQEDAAAVKYLELVPESVDAYRLRASRFATLQHYAEAAAEYQAGIEKHPLAAELYYGLGRVYERAKELKKAQATYQNLIDAAAEKKQEPLRTQARIQLANYFVRQKSFPEAEKIYQEAAARPDSTMATRNTWAALLGLSARWADAAGAMEAAAERENKERGTATPEAREELQNARYRAAVYRLAAGQKETARPGLEAALALQVPARTVTQAEAAAFVAWLGGKNANLDRLVYQKGDERWAELTWRREVQGEGELEVRGRSSPTVAAWRAALQEVQKKYPDCWAADYALARIYSSLGFTDDALAALRRVNAGRPEWWAAYFALGEYYARKRDRANGLPALRMTLALAPDCKPAAVAFSLLNGLKPTPEGPRCLVPGLGALPLRW